MKEIQPADFRYTLKIDGTDYVLLNAPEGWEETFLNFKRSGTYFGLVRSFTVPMKFVLDGAYLLRKAMYNNQLSAEVELTIEELNRQNWKYRTLYKGGIDFVEFGDSGNSDGNSVSVKATDIGVAEMIATYDRSEYEIPMNDENSVMVEIPGISIIDIAQDLVLPQDYLFLENGIRKILPNDVEENELINGYVETRISDEENNPDFSTSSNWIVKANEDTEVVVSGVFEGILSYFQSDARIIVELVNNFGAVRAVLWNNNWSTPVETFIVPPEPPLTRGTRYTRINFSATVAMIDGEKLFLTMRKTVENRGIFRVRYMPVKITNAIQTEPSQARAMRVEKLYLELIKKMNNGSDEGARSDLLASSKLFVTCGDAIREFADPVLKTTFEDFYRSIDAVENVGFGIDGVPRLERKEFFYRNAPCISLGTPKSFFLEVDQDYLYSSLKIGYKEQKYDKDQGREEFNQGQFWSNGNKKTDKVQEIISEYRADQYGIAVLRTLTILDNLKGVDTDSDNDIWFLQGSGVEEMGVHKLETGADLDYVTGIPNPETAINVRLSPHRNMIANGSFLRIGLNGFESGVLAFGSADKNADLVSQINGKVVYERKDQSISALKKPLFLPYKVKLQLALPVNSWVTITSNMFGWMDFDFNGYNFKGYIKEATSDVAKDSDREIVLNLHPETDLTKLIR